MSGRELTEPQLRRWADRAGVTLSPVTYPRKSAIFAQGDPSDLIYVVQHGWIHLSHVTEDGRSFLIRLLGPNDVLGKSALLNGASRRAYAQTLQPTRLLQFDPRDLSALVAQSDEGLRSLMTLLIEESFELQARLLAASSGNLDEELAVLLWFLQRRFGRDRSTGDITIEPKMTVTTLAKMLGRSRQRVNEAVMKLERRNVLARRSGRMTVLDLPQLQQMATPFLEGGGLANVANVTT